MGQYYKAYLQPVSKDGKTGKKKIISPWGYDLGAKLMEHSWLENPFTRAVAGELFNAPHRVCWVGDYSDDADWNNENLEIKPKEVYRVCWENQSRSECHPEPDKTERKVEDMYCVNVTKGHYFRFGDVPENDWGTDEQGNKITAKIFALSLLTAAGNGLGGGDYHMNYPAYDKVGTWVGDIIYTTETEPENMVRFSPEFVEE